MGMRNYANTPLNKPHISSCIPLHNTTQRTAPTLTQKNSHILVETMIDWGKKDRKELFLVLG